MTRLRHATRPRWHVPLNGSHRNGHAHRIVPADAAPDPLFTIRDGWSVLHALADADTDPLSGLAGWPGLWRFVGGDGQMVQRVFELPPLPAVEHDGEMTADDVQAECRAWALRTAAGALPDRWQPPDRAEVESWVLPGGLTIRAGAHARQATLIHEPGRLALACPILTSVPDELPAARRAWLRAVLIDGQDRWRLVRVSLAEAATAEVDLSGVPPVIAECLFRTSLGALRWVVAWLVESAAFLADAGVACRALEVCPSAGPPAERREVPC